jgi:hypothetical protein
VDEVVHYNNAEWVINGHKRNRFLPKYDTGTKKELKEKILKRYMNTFLLTRYVKSLLNRDIYMQQKISEKNITQ